jgi:hypothetical protein
MDETATQTVLASHSTVSLGIPAALPVDKASHDPEKTNKGELPAQPDVPVLPLSREKNTTEKANLAGVAQLLKPALWKYVRPFPTL